MTSLGLLFYRNISGINLYIFLLFIQEKSYDEQNNTNAMNMNNTNINIYEGKHRNIINANKLGTVTEQSFILSYSILLQTPY